MKPMDHLTTIVDAVAGLVHDGVILANLEGEVVYHNQAAVDLLDKPALSDLRDICHDAGLTLLPPSDDRGTDLTTSQPVIHVEQWIKGPDTERLLEFNLSRIGMPDDPEYLHLVVVSDNTASGRLDTVVRPGSDDRVITHNARMAEIIDTLSQVAPTRAPVLLQGESGTGKSMFAKIIHSNSDRADGPFVKLNCAAIPENLLESELFGHVKGAFTGASSERPGRLQAAHGGTLFLDEISEIPLHLQPKLLTALEEQRFQMVGSDDNVEVDIRIISASNQNLDRMVEEGSFRADLYYRLGVFNVEVPALRDRTEDIPLLIEHLCKTLVARGYRKDLHCTEEAMGKMLRYPWPGNIRELANAVEHAMILTRDDTVTTAALPKHVRDYAASDARNDSLESQRAEILDAIDAASGNRAEAARKLGIDRSTLWRRMHRLGIADPE